MSAYLCSQNEINALATFAADRELVADAALFADLLTLTNVAAMKERYPGRDWLKVEVLDVAAAYVFERVEWSPHCVARQAEVFDYQACELDTYETSLCKRLVDRVRIVATAIERLGGYNEDAVDREIAKQRIKPREAKAIHALLRGHAR